MFLFLAMTIYDETKHHLSTRKNTFLIPKFTMFLEYISFEEMRKTSAINLILMLIIKVFKGILCKDNYGWETSTHCNLNLRSRKIID